MDILERLTELADNLHWTWHPEAVGVFRDLEPDLWRNVNHNPIAFLNRLSSVRLDSRKQLMALESRIIRAFHTLRDYSEDKQTWGARYAAVLQKAPVAYFSAEFGLHESLPIYSGGLGVLAGDHVKAASDLGVPIVGVGLLYAKGYFAQHLDSSGWQQEEYLATDIETLPVAPVVDDAGSSVRVVLTTRDGTRIEVQAWIAKVGRAQLLLLDTNLQENPADIRELTAQLYGGDRRMRILQEYVLGVGGMRMMKAMGTVPGVLHLNEGHSAFALFEMARQIMERDGQSFHNVREPVASMTVFTTHTPVPAGHDRFDPKLVEQVLGPLREQLGLSEQEFLGYGRENEHDANESFCMTVLGLKMSRRRNAVSHLHGRLTKAMWHNIWPDEREENVPIGYVTNGVHVSSWLSVEMNRFYMRHLGEGWLKRVYDPQLWDGVGSVDREELWEINETLVGRLIAFVRRRVSQQAEARGEPDPTADESRPYLQVGALTIGFARRFAPYKRGDLLLQDIDRLDRLINNAGRPVQIIFAGKAHPADDEGKRRIQRIHAITRDPRFAGRIAFVEDYDINVARHLIQGVDVWLNCPRRPLEACGTSGMKAVLNGGLNLSVLDGWWAEAYNGTNGFAIGQGAEHSDWGHQDAMDANSLYEVLENEVVPLFYDRKSDVSIPTGWIEREIDALRTLAWRFSAHRMVTEYTRHCYLPASGGTTSSFGNGYGARLAL